MANNIGTLIIASIRPFTTTDTIATAYANEIKGGFHTVADDVERDALLTTYPDRVEDGMVVNVLNSGGVRKTYQLSGGTWVEFGSVSDLSSLSTVLSTEVSDRSFRDESLSTSILNEISDRISGDELLSTSLSIMSGSTLEIKSVMDNGELLGIVGGNLTGVTYSMVVSGESSSRISSEESLSTAISDGDALLSTSLSTEISDRISGDELLSTAILNEISGRTSIDSSLSTKLSNEISGRTSVDLSLSTAIINEISGRTSVDSSLSNVLLTKLSGLNSDLLYWNSGSSAYTAYTIPQPGSFDKSTTDPNSSNRLNYNGELWATNMISSNTRRIALITLTSGATTTWDMNLSCSAKVYLTGSTTLNISNTISGDNGTLIVIQGTSGNITFPSGSKYVDGIQPTLSGSGKLDILSFYYDGSNYYWNIGKNYA